jgi:hypothetical protein
MNAEMIKNALEKKAQEKIKVYPVEHLSASRLGHPCERYLYLLIKNWQDQKPHDVGLQHIFDLGNSIEDYTIARLKEAGFECVTPSVRSWKIENPLITGREDVRIKDPETGELLPVEIKGLSPIEFEKLNTIDDFLNSKKYYVRGYPAQLFVYMYKFEKEKGFFVITNKLTGEIKPIEVNLDYDFGEQCLQKAERIYKALETNTPPDSCDDVSVCEGCNLQHICGQVKRVPADIELDGELEELINRKEELKAAKAEYESVDKQIKERVGEREKIITGTYLIERKAYEKKAFTVPASTQYRLSIKRL